MLRDAGHPGLLLVLDEVETLQRMRGDVRDRALNALRQLVDEVDTGRFPGLFLVITGTPAFFDGPSGVPRLPPLAQRLATDLSLDPRFDNPRAVQVRLRGFDEAALCTVGGRVRDLYAGGAEAPERIRRLVDDDYVAVLARAGDRVTRGTSRRGAAGLPQEAGRRGARPGGPVRDFDPRAHYTLTLRPDELSEAERNALVHAGATSPDDVVLDP